MAYEIRPLSFAEILDTGFRVVRDHVRLLGGLGAIVYVPMAICGAAFQPGALGPHQPTVVPGSSPFVAAIVAFVLLALVGGPIVFAATTWAVGEVYVGRSPTLGACLRQATGKVVPLIGTSIIYMLIVGVGLVCFVIPGVWLFLAYLVIWPVMMLEDVFGMRALRRSRDLMKGRKGRGLGVTFAAAVITGVLSGVLQLAAGAIPYLGPIASGLAQALGMTYQVAVTNLIYFDARSRVESYDLEHLAAQVAARGAAAVP